MNVAFITGCAGFCGQHLSERLLVSGYRVVGFDRTDYGQAYVGDINDAELLRSALREVQPDIVFHLAALTNTRLDYQRLHHVNSMGTLTLLETIADGSPHSLGVVTGSSAVYGRVPERALPVTEGQPFAPLTSYAVSKITQEMIVYQQAALHSLQLIRVRPFNLTGPGESAHFVTSAFARQIAAIEVGLSEPILHVGNLTSVRDFTDVRDAVRAYECLAEYGEPGAVYNVCSGYGTSIQVVLDTLLDLSTRRDISVHVDPARLQPADVPIQIGDASKLHALTGWMPDISLRRTLEDVLNYWRMKINKELR